VSRVPSDRERWDRRYRDALAAGSAELPPAPVLVEHHALVDAQPRGPALDVACGLGRNALHLARIGFSVDAVDVSAVAVEHVAGIAAAGGLPLRAHRCDLSVAPLPGAGYELVVVTSFLDRRLFGLLPGALAAGGLLLFETFLPDPGAAYGPQDPAHVLEPGELRDAFAGLDVLAYREGRPGPDSRAVASLAARRPPSSSAAMPSSSRPSPRSKSAWRSRAALDPG
jgi:SAM-dependent methyltransferase